MNPDPDLERRDDAYRTGITVPIQSWVSTAIYRETVGIVTGMQDDVDAGYSMRRYLEDAIIGLCRKLEQDHNRGERWLSADRIQRGGINVSRREAGEIEHLQSAIDPEVRGRCFGTVNGMKEKVPGYTLRDHLELACARHNSLLRSRHGGDEWMPRDELRRGRRRRVALTETGATYPSA